MISFTRLKNDSGCHVQGGWQGHWRERDQEAVASTQGGAIGICGEEELALPASPLSPPPPPVPPSTQTKISVFYLPVLIQGLSR